MGVFCIGLSASVCYGLRQNSGDVESSVLLENIEALAQDESGDPNKKWACRSEDTYPVTRQEYNEETEQYETVVVYYKIKVSCHGYMEGVVECHAGTYTMFPDEVEQENTSI